LANVDRFSKFFHQTIRKKVLYVHITHLKIGAHLPKLLSNIKQLTFFGTPWTSLR